MSDKNEGIGRIFGYILWGTVGGVVALAAFERYGGEAFFLGFLAGCVFFAMGSKLPPAQ